jgi:hypothetical protein
MVSLVICLHLAFNQHVSRSMYAFASIVHTIAYYSSIVVVEFSYCLDSLCIYVCS